MKNRAKQQALGLGLSAALLSGVVQAQLNVPIVRNLPVVGDPPIGVLAKLPGLSTLDQNIGFVGLLGLNALPDIEPLLALERLLDFGALLSLSNITGLGALPGLDGLSASDSLPGLDALSGGANLPGLDALGGLLPTP